MRSISKQSTLIFLATYLVVACNSEQASQPTNSLIVEATGDNFNWHFRYPGDDGVLGNEDDQHSKQHLYLPINTQVTVKLKSNDYLYSFALPELQLKQIAVPDLEFELHFETGAASTLQLLGDQFCGYAHKTLVGEVRIKNQRDDFYSWSKVSLSKQ